MEESMIEPTWQSDCGRVKLWLGDCVNVAQSLEADARPNPAANPWPKRSTVRRSLPALGGEIIRLEAVVSLDFERKMGCEFGIASTNCAG